MTATSASAAPQKLPLEGVRVLELSHIVAGPSGGLILGDLGADVIKIEHPATGDTARSHSGTGSTFYSFNRNKKYLALDLGKPEGKKVFERLVAQSDVVLDNFAPGALRRLGLDYAWAKIPIAMGRTSEFEVRDQPGCLGEHTDAILASLGYSEQEIAALKTQRVALRSDRMLNIESREE
jgi:crotonobetainyl-CoA:carnitine CoA-transferase CaiB-like acyl-CoA transferase